MEQSLTRGCCDDPCSQEAARTCLCSIPALFPLGPSDSADASVQEPRYHIFFLRTGSAKGPIDIRNFLVFVYTFCAEAPPGVSPSASWHPLPVEGFFKCLCKQRLKHSRTNTQSKKYNSHSPAQGPSLLSGQQDVLLGTILNATAGQRRLQWPTQCPLGSKRGGWLEFRTPSIRQGAHS